MNSINSMQYRLIFSVLVMAGSAVMLFSQQASRTVTAADYLQHVNEPINVARARVHTKFSLPSIVPTTGTMLHPILSKIHTLGSLSGPSLPLVDTAYVYRMADTAREIYTYSPAGKINSTTGQVLQNRVWVNQYRNKFISIYDNHSSSEISEAWISDQWVNMLCDTVAYDGEGKFLSRKLYSWDRGNWEIEGNQTINYDTHGYCVSQRYEYWNDHHLDECYLSTWVNDTMGNCLSRTTIHWINGTWSNVSRETYSYDANGNMITSWSEAYHDDQWCNVCRDTSAYDDADNQVMAWGKNWTGKEWMNGGRNTSTYDSNKRILTYLTEEWSSDKYVHHSLLTHRYDDSGNILSELQQRWSSGQWMNETRETSTFDITGSMSSKFQERWLNGTWTNYYRLGYASSNNNLWSEGISESWQDTSWVPVFGIFHLHDNNGNLFVYNGYRVQLSYSSKVTPVSKEGVVAKGFELSQNYPNPFNPSTTIRYGLPSSSRVSLKIFNILGQEIADLVNTEQSSGWHEIEWSPHAASGLYFYRIEAMSVHAPYDRFTQLKEMMLIK